MLVFIDESGDPGFKLSKGSSPVFAVAMAIFPDSSSARDTDAAIRDLQKRTGIKPEFKFSKVSPDVRDQFFSCVRPHSFFIRAIVIQKDLIHSQRLRERKDDFYRFFVRQMVSNDGGRLANANVVIDGSGDRAFRQELKDYLQRMVSREVIKKLKFKNSRNDVLVQLADMCVGAIARSYREDRGEPYRWRNQLASKIDDVWEFK